MLLSCGVEIVIVTLGARGCYVKTREWSEYFSAISFPSIDNTGASDAFISAFASYLMMGYSIQNAVRIASYAAGFCIPREGIVPALIDKNSLESYIRQRNPELLQKKTALVLYEICIEYNSSYHKRLHFHIITFSFLLY